MKFPFHVYLDKLEKVAKDAETRAPGLWSSPRSPVEALRCIVANDRHIADYLPAQVMRHVVESQPRVLIALIGVVRVLAERLAKCEQRMRESELLLKQARRWVPDPNLGDEIETMLRLPTGRAALSAEGLPDEIPSSFGLEIEVPE